MKPYRIECSLPDTVRIAKSTLNGWGLFAKQAFKKDEIIYTASFIAVNLRGFPTQIELVADGTTYLLQTGNHTTPYVNNTRAVYTFDTLMNHHCLPSTHDKADPADPFTYHVFATRDLKEGEELTCNYNTFKWINDHPFACRCGSIKCCGRVEGYSKLSEQQKEDIKHWTDTSALMLKGRRG